MCGGWHTLVSAKLAKFSTSNNWTQAIPIGEGKYILSRYIRLHFDDTYGGLHHLSAGQERTENRGRKANDSGHMREQWTGKGQTTHCTGQGTEDRFPGNCPTTGCLKLSPPKVNPHGHQTRGLEGHQVFYLMGFGGITLGDGS